MSKVYWLGVLISLSSWLLIRIRSLCHGNLCPIVGIGEKYVGIYLRSSIAISVIVVDFRNRDIRHEYVENVEF